MNTSERLKSLIRDINESVESERTTVTDKAAIEAFNINPPDVEEVLIRDLKKGDEVVHPLMAGGALHYKIRNEPSSVHSGEVKLEVSVQSDEFSEGEGNKVSARRLKEKGQLGNMYFDEDTSVFRVK